jgi:hypothetical protein
VLPPTVGGIAISGPAPLPFGRVLELGSLRLWLEAESPQESAAAAPKTGAGIGGAGAVASAATRAAASGAPTGGRARRGAPEEPEQGQERERRPRRRGLPVSLLIVPSALILAGLVWFLRSALSGSAPEVVAAASLVDQAERDFQDGHFQFAEENLAQAESGGRLDALTQARIADLRARIAMRKAEVDLLIQNNAGTNFLDTRLKKYEEKFLSGTPDPVKARLFLERCKEFRERWPKHPEMPWVERQEARFRGVIDLSKPKTWPEVAWEVEDLADEMPCNYAKMLALVDEFLTRASGADETAAKAEQAKVLAARPAYHLDRLQQARYEYEQKGDPSKAVWWLVHEVIWIGDPVLSEEAAKILLDMPDLAPHLEGYKQTYPDKFAALMENDGLRAFAATKGLVN